VVRRVEAEDRYSPQICNVPNEDFVLRLSALNYYVTQRSYLCFQHTGMRRITTFRLTRNRIYYVGPIRLQYYNIIL
jgi:hypothetical protein